MVIVHQCSMFHFTIAMILKNKNMTETVRGFASLKVVRQMKL